MKKKERDPNLLWLDDGRRYVIIEGGRFTVVFDDDEGLGIDRGPEVLLQTAVVTFGDKTDDGALVATATIPWFEIANEITRNPQFMFRFSAHPRKFEEFIAGAYSEAGWDEVTLTPARGDKGRDVIATKTGLCSFRVLDQLKAYAPHNLVTHDEVRGLIGVVSMDRNASKGLLTTTSDFAPTILTGDEFKPLIPYRLELKNGQQLAKWLTDISSQSGQLPTSGNHRLGN